MQPQAARRKGIGTRVWLIISESGSSYLREVGKHSIMRRTGLPARDLRALDPMLSYPSSILGRERAIVVNLEHIKAIVTAKEVLMLNSTNPLVAQFVEYLKGRILASNVEAPTAREGNNTDMEDVTETTCTPESVLNRQINTNSYNTETQTSADALAAGDTEKNDNIHKTLKDAPVSTGPKSLPFEFRALEACLESACRCLESETRTLEDEAYPALDELTSKISTLNLERVRQIKSRLVDISGRVQKVRDELEHLLDDDNDMAEMYLTEKLIAQSLELASSRENVDNPALEEEDERTEESKSDCDSDASFSFKPNIEELEMLLEAYFVQIDGVLQKLSDMSEYVDDTEDYINIMLDDKQNQLLQMGVLLSTANMVLNAGIVVVGIFGMNIEIEIFKDGIGKPRQFWETVAGTVGGMVALYLIAYGWGKKKRLLAS